MRITDSMRMRLTLADLGNINAENSRLLQQEGTGKKLLRPSDDPSGAIRQLRLHSDIQQQADEKTRIATGVDTIQNTSLALDDVVSVLQSAKELGVQGATSSLSTSHTVIAIHTHKSCEKPEINRLRHNSKLRLHNSNYPVQLHCR